MVNILQYIDGVKYNEYSLINENNVIGKYSVLSENEVALPLSFKDMYDLEQVIDKIKQVGKTKTSVILSTIIESKSIL
jgi:Lrp/AsnC family leucine-responsive transcriptional regulator